MSEDQVPYGDEAKQWERDSQELRALMETAGYSQIATAQELGYTDRSIRSYCSGREPVPRAVLYAMRWVAENKPNRERWMQVHWKKLNMKVSSSDQFVVNFNGDQVQMLVSGRQAFLTTWQNLISQGIVSLHNSYSSDRFLLSAELANRVVDIAAGLPRNNLRGPMEAPNQLGGVGGHTNILGTPERSKT